MAEIMKGYLAKKSPKAKVLGVWQHRFFTLTTTELVYYKKHDRAELGGAVPLKDMLSVVYFPHKKKGGRFDVTVKGGRIFELEASDKLLAKGWVMAINKQRKVLKDAEDAKASGVTKDVKEGGVKLSLIQEKFFEFFLNRKDPHFPSEEALLATGFADDTTILMFLLQRSMANMAVNASITEATLPMFVEWDEEFESEKELEVPQGPPDTSNISKQIAGYFANKESYKAASSIFDRLSGLLKSMGTLSPFHLYLCLSSSNAQDLRRFATLYDPSITPTEKHNDAVQKLMKHFGFKFEGFWPRDDHYPEEQYRHPLLLILTCNYAKWPAAVVEEVANLCKTPPHAVPFDAIQAVFAKLSPDELVQYLRLTGEQISDDVVRSLPLDAIKATIFQKFNRYYLFEAPAQSASPSVGISGKAKSFEEELDDYFGDAGGPELQAGGGVASFRKCEECEDREAKIVCEDCDQYFCAECAAELHSKGGRVRHIRKELKLEVAPPGVGLAPPPPPEDDIISLAPPPAAGMPCEECEEAPAKSAEFYCVSCKQSLCPACDDALHKKGKRMAHIRTPILAGGIKIDVKLCEECEKDPPDPAAVECPSCEQVLCASCDHALHAKGNRAAHVRQPTNVEYYEQKNKAEEQKRQIDEATKKAAQEKKQKAEKVKAEEQEQEAMRKHRESKAVTQTAIGRINLLVKYFDRLIRISSLESTIEKRIRDVKLSVDKCAITRPSAVSQSAPGGEPEFKFKIVNKYKLPAGWQELKDPSSGKPYYYEVRTQQTSWEPPPGSRLELTPVIETDWQELIDPTTNNKYYYNAKTSTTTWEQPAEVKAAYEAAEKKMKLDLASAGGDKAPLASSNNLSLPALLAGIASKKLAEGIYELPSESKEGQVRYTAPSHLIVGYRARANPYPVPEGDGDRFVPMVTNPEFVRRLLSVFKEEDSFMHSLAVRILWVHLSKCCEAKEAEQRFSEYLEIHASKEKYSKRVGNAILAALCTNNTSVNLDLRLIVLPTMNVTSPLVWKGLFYSLRKTNLHLRKSALEDVIVLLYDNHVNCASLIQYSGWQQWLWPLIEDVHQGEAEECTDIERHVFANLNHILTTLHFYAWKTSATFMLVLCATIESVRDFAGFTDASQQVVQLFLFSLVSALMLYQHKYPIEYSKSDPHWQNFLMLDRICQKFIFCTSYWRSSQEGDIISAVIKKKVREDQAARSARQQQHVSHLRLAEMKAQDSKAKDKFVISAARTLTREKFESFWKEDHKLLEYGLHFTEEGDVADGPLIDKLLKLYQLLGLDHTPLNPHMSSEEKTFRNYCLQRYHFWKDSQRIVSSIQGHALKKQQMTFRMIAHSLQKFCLAADSKTRIKIIEKLEQIQSQGEYQDMSLEFESIGD